MIVLKWKGKDGINKKQKNYLQKQTTLYNTYMNDIKTNKKKNVIRNVFICLVVVSVVIIALAVIGSNLSVDNTEFFIGDVVTTGNVDFKVNSVDNTQHIGTQYVGKDTENNFVVINITVKNNNNTAFSFNLTDGKCQLKNGDALYDISSNTIYAVDGYIWGDIEAGTTKTFEIVFETPTATTADTYVLVVKGKGLTAKKVGIKIKTRN